MGSGCCQPTILDDDLAASCAGREGGETLGGLVEGDDCGDLDVRVPAAA